MSGSGLGSAGGYAVARYDATVYVLVRGLANMGNSPVLDMFLRGVLEDGVRSVYMDLSECRGMDSTFMGSLIGFHGRYKDVQGRFTILNPNAASLKLLKMLGISSIVPVLNNSDIPTLRFVELTSDETQTPRQRAEFMLEAHRHLIDLSEENRSKFSGFIKALEADLDKLN